MVRRLRRLNGLWIALALLTVSILLDLFFFPLSRQDIYSKMEAEDVVFERWSYGVVVFLTETDGVPMVHMFTESMFLPRYHFRHLFPHIHHAPWDFNVPGKWRFVRLDNEGWSITFSANRPRLPRIDQTMAILILLGYSGKLLHRAIRRKTPDL